MLDTHSVAYGASSPKGRLLLQLNRRGRGKNLVILSVAKDPVGGR